jgi:hypothetical protein
MTRVVEAGAIVLACAVAVVCGSRIALSPARPAAVEPLTQPAPEPRVARTVAPTAPAAEVAPQPAAQPGAWGARRSSAVDTMRADFRQAARLDEMFERGLRDPAGGGLFYARQALRYCGVLRGAGSVASDAGPDGALLTRARARCATLGDSASRQRLDATMATSTSRLDPAMSLVGDLEERLRGDRLRGVDVAAALDEAVALGDPYVLRNVFLRGLSRVDRFDGQPVDATLRGELMTASRLAVCDLGLDCTQDARVLVTCGGKAGCTAPLAAMGGADAATSDERQRAINELSTRLVVAADDGSLGSLFR